MSSDGLKKGNDILSESNAALPVRYNSLLQIKWSFGTLFKTQTCWVRCGELQQTSNGNDIEMKRSDASIIGVF
jgi:hypothetical protein